MQRGRVKQSNLDLHSELSLSVLAASNSGGSLSVGSGRGNDIAAVFDSPPKISKGVTTTRPQRPSMGSFSSNRDSCSSDTDQVTILYKRRLYKPHILMDTSEQSAFPVDSVVNVCVVCRRAQVVEGQRRKEDRQ